MKSDKWVTAGIASVLAYLLCFGAVGGMISAFGLTLKSYPSVVLVWLFSAFICAAAFSWKRGGILVLFLTALLAGYLWRRGELMGQLFQLIYRMTYVYDKAYGWGVFQPADALLADSVDLPLAILGAVIAMVTAWTVCRGIGSYLAIGLALLPLSFCLVVTDTVPETGNLFALIFGILILLLTSRVRSSSPFQGNRLTLLAAIPTALALGGLFLAVPQDGYVNQSAEIRENILSWFQQLPESLGSSVQEVAVSIQSSEPETVDLASMGRRIETTAPVMDVTAEVGGTLYLRGQDYDVYDGTGWTASSHRVEDFLCDGVSLGSVDVETRNKLEQLYLPYYPANGQSLVGGKLDNPRLYTEYSFSRTGLPDNWQALAASETEPDTALPFVDAAGVERLAYRSLPDQTRSKAEYLLASILQGQTTTTEKATAIANFVRNSARYDLDTSRMPKGEEDFALWFLEESETGYCVHFATAAVVLLRAASIEARYVSGYMVRTLAGETVTVTGENAHAWAEYYEPSLGVWVVLEATPADLSAQAGTSGNMQATLPSTEPGTRPTETQPQPSIVPQPSAESSGTTPFQQQSRPQDPGRLKRLLKFLLLLVIVAAGTEGQRKIRLRLRRRSQRTGAPNAQALARWQETELLAKLLREAPPQDLETLAQKAKFSQHTLPAEELALFESHLRTARRRLRQKPWYLRMAHRYIFAIY